MEVVEEVKPQEDKELLFQILVLEVQLQILVLDLLDKVEVYMMEVILDLAHKLWEQEAQVFMEAEVVEVVHITL
jgi:hypothetical protein